MVRGVAGALALLLAACSLARTPGPTDALLAELELRRLKPGDRIHARLPGTTAADRHRRIEYVRTHPETPREIARAILRGEISTGMHKHEVVAAWGPDVLEANGPGGATVGAGGFKTWSNACAGLVLEFIRYGLLWHIEVAPPEWAGTPSRVAVILPRER